MDFERKDQSLKLPHELRKKALSEHDNIGTESSGSFDYET